MDREKAERLVQQALSDGWMIARKENLGGYKTEWWQVYCIGYGGSGIVCGSLLTYRPPKREELSWSQRSFSYEEIVAAAERD